MTTLNEEKYAGIVRNFSGTLQGTALQDIEREWLQAGGASPGPLNAMWHQFWTINAIPTGHFNDRAHAYFNFVLIPAGHINERWRAFWVMLPSA